MEAVHILEFHLQEVTAVQMSEIAPLNDPDDVGRLDQMILLELEVPQCVVDLKTMSKAAMEVAAQEDSSVER